MADFQSRYRIPDFCPIPGSQDYKPEAQFSRIYCKNQWHFQLYSPKITHKLLIFIECVEKM
jgi:hypothetical protein